MLDVGCWMLIPMSPRDRFLEKLRVSFGDRTFAKLTLSQPARSGDLRNFYAREVELRKGRSLSCVWRYATRDVTKNLSPAAAILKIGEMLGSEFTRAHLFTISGD